MILSLITKANMSALPRSAGDIDKIALPLLLYLRVFTSTLKSWFCFKIARSQEAAGRSP